MRAKDPTLADSGTLVLDVWREACRHIRLDESIERIASRLGQCLPLGALLVRRVDVHRSLLETVAMARPSEQRRAPAARSLQTAEELDALLAWIARGAVARLSNRAARRGTTNEALARVAPDGTKTEALVGPLAVGEGSPGVLVALAAHGAAFDAHHAAILQQVLEPLTVALENDRRVAELQALREAADAERQSLLSRLGGQEIAEAVVGVEGGLRDVIERVELVALSDVPVLLLGETGSGKEVVARIIHRSSPRVDGPFLRVNCGAIPPELVDSELFGHERGSFTGAESTRKGWFERADGGTLLLDEIGELAPAAQVRLLRVLQDGTFERVGGQRTLRVDVRVVAATHRDLQAMIVEGSFRRDLWYRIAVFPIRVPPLRERLGDIPILATHFALKAARRFGNPPLAPSPSDLALLMAYPWPGNVRELSSVIERSVILGNGRLLEVAKALGISATSGAEPMKEELVRGVSDEPQRRDAAAPGALNEAMSQHIRSALAHSRGRIEGPFGAAAALDINPHTLRSRMRRLGIDWRGFRPSAR